MRSFHIAAVCGVALALLGGCSSDATQANDAPTNATPSGVVPVTVPNHVVRPTEESFFAQFGARSLDLSNLNLDDYSFDVNILGEHAQSIGTVLVRQFGTGVQYDLADSAGVVSTYARFTLADGSTATRFVAQGKDLFIEQTKDASGKVTRTRFFATDLATNAQSILVVDREVAGTEADIQTWVNAAGMTPVASSPGVFELIVLNQDPAFANAVASFLSASAPSLNAADLASSLHIQSGSDTDPLCDELLAKIPTLSMFALGSCALCPSFIAAIGVTVGTATPVAGPGAAVACTLCAGALAIDVGTLITCFIRSMTAKSNEQCATECSHNNKGAVGAWNGRVRECTCVCDDTLCKSSAMHDLGPGVKLCSAGCKGKGASDCEPHTQFCGNGEVENASGCTEVCDGKAGCPSGKHCNDSCSACEPDGCHIIWHRAASFDEVLYLSMGAPTDTCEMLPQEWVTKMSFKPEVLTPIPCVGFADDPQLRAKIAKVDNGNSWCQILPIAKSTYDTIEVTF